MLTPLNTIAGAAPEGISVNPSSTSELVAGFSTPVYVGISYNANGVEYSRSSFSQNNWTASIRGVWLVSGINEEAWVEHTLISGDSLDDRPTAGRNILTSTRNYGYEIVGPEFEKNGIHRFDFWNAATGGNLLASVQFEISVLDLQNPG